MTEKRAARRVLGKAVGWWLAVCRSCSEQKHEVDRRVVLLRQVVLRLRTRVLAAAFSTWASGVREKRRQQALCSRLIRRLMNRAVSLAFDGWKGFTAARKRERNVLLRVGARLMSRSLFTAFARWHEVVEQQRRGKHVGSGELPFGWTQFQGWKEVPAPLEFSRRILREGRAFPNFASLDRGRS